MSDDEVTGSCLCGRVRYAVSGNLGIFQYCHCSRCRKFTGSAHAANILVAPAHFRWLCGEEHVGRYAPADARHFATSFCKHCGSSLPWLAQTGRAVAVPAGTLDDVPPIRPSQNVFFASRAAWYEPAAALPEYDELPPRRR
ncbi:MAG: GFA family protein [Gammaproteobacteria bacterium]|nr:GFA family protein [Gammaproteobacteria bacterium]